MKITIRPDTPDLYQEGSAAHKRHANDGSCSIYLEGRRLFGLTYLDLHMLHEFLVDPFNRHLTDDEPEVLDILLRVLLYRDITSPVISMGNGKFSIGYIGKDGSTVKKLVLTYGQLSRFMDLMYDALSDDVWRESVEAEL